MQQLEPLAEPLGFGPAKYFRLKQRGVTVGLIGALELVADKADKTPFDPALTVGAKGGLVLAGGILPQMTDALLASRFRVQFEAKGRFCPWLTAIPTSLIVHADPAIIGLAGLL